MKKAILTFGLFSLVLVLTSFTTPENLDTAATAVSVEKGDTGGVKLPGDGKKVDFETGGVKLPGDGKKIDFETGGVKLPGDGKKLD